MNHPVLSQDANTLLEQFKKSSLNRHQLSHYTNDGLYSIFHELREAGYQIERTDAGGCPTWELRNKEHINA